MIPGWLGGRVKAWATAFDRETMRLARLYRLYRRAAGQGWRIIDAGHWEFFMVKDKNDHMRWPPSGTCEMDELEKVLWQNR